jgi:arylsulfatase A-like enzyme
MLAGAAAFACAPDSRPAPDIIVITLDTTRADHLGVYGYAREVSPSIDSFAADAVTYERAWATGAWTLPTHASILTGRYVSNHGAHFDLSAANASLSEVFEGEFFEKHKANRLHEDEVTLAELLAERGYATAAFAGGPWLAPPFGLMQGYQNIDAQIDSVAGRSAEELTDRFITWMESVPSDRPLHGLVNYFDPHTPWEPPPGFDDLPGAKIPLDSRQDPIFINAGVKLSRAQRVAAVDRYDGEIRYMDFHLGRLLEALKRAGRYDDAMIVIVGDHGELFGEHGVMGHGRWLYEPVVRIPLLVRFPDGRGAGTAEDAAVSQVDLLPMIAEVVPLSLPDGIDGRPVGTRMSILAEAFRDPFSVNHFGDRYDRDLVTLVQWPWKLIESDTGRREIYDLDADPQERQNQQQAEAKTELARELANVVGRLNPRLESAPPLGVSPELQRDLQALGYIE